MNTDFDFDPGLIIQLHLLATLFMTGIIWFVQIVHYPLFALVGRQGFADYSRRHQARTSCVVGPPMLLEMTTSTILVLLPELTSSLTLTWAGFLLLIVIWLTTAIASVPAHGVLEKGFNAGTHRWLVTSNWIRTVSWTGRAVIALLIQPANH